MKEFRIDFSQDELDGLRRRIDTARLPREWKGAGWSYGTDSDYLRKLLAYWRDEYDWRHRERELNRYPQFTCELDGTTIHFFHIRSSRKNAPACCRTMILSYPRCRVSRFRRCLRRGSATTLIPPDCGIG